MAYNPVAVFPGGSPLDTYLTRGADLSGNADGKEFTFAFHIRPKSTAGTGFICANNGTRYQVSMDSGGQLRLEMENVSAGTRILTARTNNSLAVDTNYSVLIAGNLATAAQGDIEIWLGDSLQALTFIDGPTDDTIDFTNANHALFATTGGGSILNADIADFRFFKTRIPFQGNEANRRLFFDTPANNNALVKPSSNGAVNASIGTVTPIVFFGGDGATAANWNTNKGSGGGYTVNGTGLQASANPPPGVEPASQGVGSSAGVAAVSAIGAAVSRATGNIAGTAAVSAAGAATAESAGTSAGQATVEAVSEFGSVGSSAGVATASGVILTSGEAWDDGTYFTDATGFGTRAAGASAGQAAVSGISESIASTAGVSAGAATAAATSGTSGVTTGTSGGSATVAAVGGSVAKSVGEVFGSAGVSGVSALIAASSGVAAGSSSAVADGAAIVGSTGVAAGTSAVVGRSLQVGVGRPRRRRTLSLGLGLR